MSNRMHHKKRQAMADYLFSIRWEEQKERLSIVSLINHSDEPTEIIEIEQLKQKIEQFTLSQHGDVEIKMRCGKLEMLNAEAQPVINKLKSAASTSV